MRVRERIRMHPAGHEPGEMRHVHHEMGAHTVRDFAEAPKVDDARIGRAAGNDHLGPMLLRKPRHFVHVDAMIVAPHPIRHRLEPFAGNIDWRPMGQVPAGSKIEPQKRVARLHQRHERRRIGGSPRMGLHVGIRAAEQLCDPLDGQRFGNIDVLATAVIAPSRQALGILVGEHRALCLEHGAADNVL